MIKIKGTVTLSGDFEVVLDMTEEEFDALSNEEQNEELESAIDWRNVFENSETDGIDVWDLDEVDEEEGK